MKPAPNKSDFYFAYFAFFAVKFPNPNLLYYVTFVVNYLFPIASGFSALLGLPAAKLTISSTTLA